MELTDKLRAKTGLFFVGMELGNRRDQIKQDRPQRTDLIEDLDKLFNLVTESLEVFNHLDKENDELIRSNFAKETQILKLEREIRELNNELQSKTEDL